MDEPASTAVGFWRLSAVPEGYQPPVVADYSAPDTRILQYFPSSGAFGGRISVQATVQTVDELTAGYEVLGTTQVRGVMEATHFRIGEDPGARHGLVWDESGSRIAIYAFASLDDLRALARQAVPCDAAARCPA